MKSLTKCNSFFSSARFAETVHEAQRCGYIPSLTCKLITISGRQTHFSLVLSQCALTKEHPLTRTCKSSHIQPCFPCQRNGITPIPALPRSAELPRVVSVLLAWEGAIVAGAFLAAIAYVAANAYMMERFDERTRLVP